MLSMTRLRLRVQMYVISYSFSWLKLAAGVPVPLTKRGSAIEARLHTAISPAEVYSTISVHRLEPRMQPRFCWLDLRLHASLYSMYGVPVSICASRIANHSSCALTALRACATRGAAG